MLHDEANASIVTAFTRGKCAPIGIFFEVKNLEKKINKSDGGREGGREGGRVEEGGMVEWNVKGGIVESSVEGGMVEWNVEGG